MHIDYLLEARPVIETQTINVYDRRGIVLFYPLSLLEKGICSNYTDLNCLKCKIFENVSFIEVFLILKGQNLVVDI